MSNKKTEKLSRVIEYVGSFDISQIVSNFKKMQDTLKNRGASETDILGLDNELDKIKGMDKVIQKAIAKGFKTPKDFSEFEQSTKLITKAIEKLNEEYRKIDKDSLNYSLKSAERSASLLNQKLEQTEKQLQKNATKMLQGAENEEKIKTAINENIESAKKQERAQHNINELLRESLSAQDKKVENTKKELEQSKNLQKVYEQQIAAIGEMSKVQIFNDDTQNKNFKNNFLNKNNYKKLDGSAVSALDMDNVSTALQGIFNKKKVNLTEENVNKVFEDLGLQLVNTKKKITLLNTAYTAYRAKVDSLGQSLKEQKQKTADLNSTLKEQEKIQTNLKNATSDFGSSSLTQGYKTLVETIDKKNAAETNVSNIKNSLNAPLPGLENNSKAVSNLNRQLVENADRTKAAMNSQRELDSVFDQLGNRLKYIFSFMNMYHVALRQIKQTFTDIQKIDKAFAEIAMVTDKTIDDMWQQYDDYASMANELGQTTESVIKSSALFYQQGLQTNEVLSLTKDTMKLATLAGIDFKESTKLMTAALRSFHMEMEQGSHVTDVYSELAAHAAANVQDIAYAMSKTSSIAASAGMGFENLSAMLTTMIEATQEAPISRLTYLKYS